MQVKKWVWVAIVAPIVVWAVLFVAYVAEAQAWMERVELVQTAGASPINVNDTAHVWLFGVDVAWPAPSLALNELSPLANYTIGQLPLVVLMQTRIRLYYSVHPQYCQGEWADYEVAAADSAVEVLDRAIVTYEVGATFGMPSTAPVYDLWAPGEPGSWEYYNPWR